MKRRDVLRAFGGVAAAWPFAASAQSSRTAVAGFLSSRSAEQAAHLLAPVVEGLKQSGFVVGQNLTMEQRYADNHYDRLPALARDLVERHVEVIIAGGTSNPAIAATKTIPIVFTSGLDPVRAGLVNSLSRPNGNVTGISFYSGALNAKRMDLLRQLAPATATFGFLINPDSPLAAPQIADAQSAASAISCPLQVLGVHNEEDITTAINSLTQSPKAALIVGTDPYDSRVKKIVGMAATHSLPAIYYLRQFVDAGGLISYGASITDTYRQAGVYAGRILHGAKPSELPVQLPTRFELVINAKTAGALGLKVPLDLQASADDVID
jgi:putative ABC transport system substrate-binding protein